MSSSLHLISLLFLALHPDAAVPEALTAEPIDWSGVFREAKRQAVSGLAYSGVEQFVKLRLDLAPDPMLMAQWYGMADYIRQVNLMVNRQTAQVTAYFAEHGFRSTVMKGQGNTLFYPEHLCLLRNSGDIDVWGEGGYRRVTDFVQSVYLTRKVNELEMPFALFSDTEVEVHYRPLILRNPITNRRLQRFFASETEACFSNRISLPTADGQTADSITTTLRFNLVHQLAHIHLHLFTEGIGLRQLIDYYMLLSHADPALREDAMRVIRSLRLRRFASALMWIMQSVFGLPADLLLCEPSEADGRFLLDEVMQTGNFGNQSQERRESQQLGIIQRGTRQIFFRNLRYHRFDRTEWFWGPVWRIYHRLWRMLHGYM